MDMQFNNLNIYQVYISKSLEHFNRIENIYNLTNCNTVYDANASCLFFGMFDHNDLTRLSNHRGHRYILWGGSDADISIYFARTMIMKIKYLPNVTHFAISNNIHQRLNALNIKNIFIDFNLTDTSMFSPLKNVTATKIYIYNGFNKGSEKIYGNHLYEQIVKILPQFEYIYSNTLNIPHSDMPSVYSQCFIGLRLTTNDGNANTVKEMISMGIPVVHNGDYPESLKWKTIDDIVNHIKNNYKKL